MKIDEKYKIHINSYSHKGLGVGRVNGFVIMVPGALCHEDYDITIRELYGSYAVASLNKTETSSENRREPFCKYFSKCGGCDLQHMSTLEELKFKKDTVKNALLRIGGVSEADSKKVFNDVLGMDNPFAYRNNVQYHADGQGSFGFYKNGTNEIVDIDYCPIQSDLANELYKSVKEFCRRNNITNVNGIVIRTSFSQQETMLILKVKDDFNSFKGMLVDFISEKHPECTSLYFNIKSENVLIYGKEVITEQIRDLKFNISPQSFFQVNTVQTEALYNKVLEFTGLTGNEKVYDLYCGTGTIGLFLANRAKRITGVETNPSAVDDAVKNAEINDIKNVLFVKGKAEDYMEQISAEREECDVVIIDPPRAGCDKKLLSALLRVNPKRIVYVSCNPATLARDLKILTDGCYRADKIQSVNMFPWTKHVECVVLMTKVQK